MSTSSSNPYPHGTPEHMLWARWQRAFFQQPVHGQLMVIESQLRQAMTTMFQLNAAVSPPDVQHDMRCALLSIEESLDLLNEAAEHAFVRLVARNSPATKR